jgi:hypothetical protein
MQNLFCNFWTLLQVSTNFGSLKQFLEFKQLKNDFKSSHSVVPATRGRTEGRLGHDLAARLNRGGSPRRAETGARVGTVTRSTAARWRLAGGKVLLVSTSEVPGWRRVGGVEAGLTLAAARCEGAERRRRRRGGGWRRGSGGSGERWGGPAARAEAREKIRPAGGGSVLKGAAGRGPRGVGAAWRRSGRERGALGVARTALRRSVWQQRPGRGARERRCACESEGQWGRGDAERRG